MKGGVMMIAFIRYEESKAFLTVQETAKLLNVSVSTVYRLIESGELLAKKVRFRYIIKAGDLEQYINQ